MGKNTFSTHLAEYLTEYTHTEDISNMFLSNRITLKISAKLVHISVFTIRSGDAHCRRRCSAAAGLGRGRAAQQGREQNVQDCAGGFRVELWGRVLVLSLITRDIAWLCFQRVCLAADSSSTYPNVVCCCLQSAAHKSGFKVIV